MQMTETEVVIAFLENWQATLQEAATIGCQFSNLQQVILLLLALPDSWDSFITSQGCIIDLILQNWCTTKCYDEQKGIK